MGVGCAVRTVGWCVGRCAPRTLPGGFSATLGDAGYRLDLVIDHRVVVELKAVRQLEKIHEAQLLTYLKLTGLKLGLLLTFNVVLLKDGIKEALIKSPVRPELVEG